MADSPHNFAFSRIRRDSILKSWNVGCCGSHLGTVSEWNGRYLGFRCGWGRHNDIEVWGNSREEAAEFLCAARAKQLKADIAANEWWEGDAMPCDEDIFG